MKPIKIFMLFLLFMGLLFCTSSCTTVYQTRHDNGKHLGWYKHSNNPHHPQSTHPGKSKGKNKK